MRSIRPACRSSSRRSFRSARRARCRWRATLYKGLLWGEQPAAAAAAMRAELHARYTSRWHDWASLVVYEALPQALDEQLDTRRSISRPGAPWTRRWSGSTSPCARRATQRDSLARARRGDRRAPSSASPSAGRTESNASVCARARASGSRRRRSRWRRRRRWPTATETWRIRSTSSSRHGSTTTRGSRPARQRRARSAADGHAALGAGAGRVARRGAGQARAIRAGGKRRSFAPRCTASIRTTSSAPGRTASLAELWLIRLAEPTSMTTERAGASSANRALQHATSWSRLYPSRRRVSRHIDAGVSSRAMSTGGADPRFEQRCRRARSRAASADWDARSRRCIDTANPPRWKCCSRDRRADAGGGCATPPPDGVRRPSAPRAPAATARGAPRTPAPARSRPPDQRRADAARVTANRRARSFFDIEMLPAGHGDCLWIEYGDESATHRWLIDCGTQPTRRGPAGDASNRCRRTSGCSSCSC